MGHLLSGGNFAGRSPRNQIGLMLTDHQTRQLAVAVLCATAAGLVAFLWRGAMRTGYTWAQLPFYPLLLFYGRVIWRTTVSGPLPIGDRQGAVIVANHRSTIDPAFVQLAANRLGHWMVAREFCEMPGMAWLFRVLWAIPVNRAGNDTAATKAAIRFAVEGDLVGLFPEGRMNTTPAVLLPGRPGAALIALKARVPVIPCYIRVRAERRHDFWHFHDDGSCPRRGGPADRHF